MAGWKRTHIFQPALFVQRIRNESFDDAHTSARHGCDSCTATLGRKRGVFILRATSSPLVRYLLHVMQRVIENREHVHRFRADIRHTFPSIIRGTDSPMKHATASSPVRMSLLQVGRRPSAGLMRRHHPYALPMRNDVASLPRGSGRARSYDVEVRLRERCPLRRSYVVRSSLLQRAGD
jgi:hypothetical protein